MAVTEGVGACAVIVLLLASALVAVLAQPMGDSPVTVPDQGQELPRSRPLVIAHRGASATCPENTIGAFRQASTMGADYIEGDLVVTRDDVLVARHERQLSATTNVEAHPEFADRRVTKEVNGDLVNDWFVEDFTVAELKTLQATTRDQSGGSGAVPQTAVPPEDSTIPTIEEMISFVQGERASGQRPLGLYLELKDPGYFTSLGLTPEPLIVEALVSADLTGRDASVFVESFDSQSLVAVHNLVDTPLVQLVGGIDQTLTSPEALATIATYASGVGIERDRLLTTGTLDGTVIGSAHQSNLEVHVYTFSDQTYDEAVSTSYRSYFEIGADGVFTDNPDMARQAVDSWQVTSSASGP